MPTRAIQDPSRGREPEERGGLRPFAGWSVTLAAVLLVVLLPFFFDRLARDPAGLSALARLEPLEVRLPTDAAPTQAERDFRAGLAAYQGGDRARAAQRLHDALDAEPERAEALLYLGSTLLLEHRAKDAVAVLADVQERGPGPLADEAAWQLAQAHLLLREESAARFHLRRLAAGDGAHAPAARELLDRLDAL